MQARCLFFNSILVGFLGFLFFACSESPDDEQHKEPGLAAGENRQVNDAQLLLVQADTLLAQGKAFSLQFKLDSAWARFERAVEIYESLAKAKEDSILWQKYLEAQNQLPNLLRRKGKLVPAMEKARQLLAFGREKLGEDNPQVASAYNNIGVIFWQQGRLDSALYYGNIALKKRLAILTYPHVDLADSYNNLAIVYWRSGALDTALFFYHKGLDIRLKTQPVNHIHIGITYNNLGLVHWSKSDLVNALIHFEKGMEIARFHKNPLLMSSIYTNLGQIYRLQGDFHRALETHRRSQAELRPHLPPQHDMIARSYEAMAANYHGLGDIQESILHHHKAIQMWQQVVDPDHPDIGTAYMNLGNIYNEETFIADSALACYHKSLSIRRKSLPPDHPEIAQVYANLGNVHLKLQQFAIAQKYYEQALAVFQKEYPPQHHFTGGLYAYIGDFYTQKKNYDLAFQYYQKAQNALVYKTKTDSAWQIPALENIISEKELGVVLHKKAQAFMYAAQNSKTLPKKKRWQEKALTAYEEAVELLEKQRQSYQNEGSKLRLNEAGSTLFGEAIACAGALFTATGDSAYQERMFKYVEKSRAGALLEQLYESEARRFADIPGELLEQERQLRIDLTYYDNLQQQERQKKNGSDSLKLAEYEQRFLNLKENYDALLKTFETDYPRYYTLKYRQPAASTAALQQALGDQSVLVEYFLADSLVYTFVLDSDKLSVLQTPKGKQFSQKLDTLLAAITDGRYRKYVSLARHFYQVLLAPVADKIAGKNLLLIPDGVLARLPFEALLTVDVPGESMDYAKLPYLLKQRSLSYAYSAALWLETRAPLQTQPGNTYLAFAPLFRDGINNAAAETLFAENAADTTRSANAFLRASQTEVNGIQNLFYQQRGLLGGWWQRLFGKEVAVFLDKDASEKQVKATSLGQYRYIHFATHGFVHKLTPDFSGLLFADPPGSPEDGVLYARELYNLRLNADLVVASACETGLGKLSRGEGLLGLGRGFTYAGARNLLVSLWKVNDISTAEVMIAFYDHLLKGKSKAAALRAAKLQLIENTPLYAKPHFWAPFILIGQ